MKITRIKAISAGYMKVDPEMHRGFSLVKIDTDAGHVGWGEASSSYGHSYPTVVETIVDDVLADVLVGKNPLAIRARLADMHLWLDGYLGWDGISAQVIGAIEIALWDIFGKEHGVSIAALLGAGVDSLPLYATGTTSFDADLGWHETYFDDVLAVGIKAIKVRLGNDPDRDLELIARTRRAIGDDCLLMADGYWTYTLREAIRLARRMEPYNVSFYEEPIPQYMIEALAELRAESPVRIAVGERVFSLAGFTNVVHHRAADVLQPDPTVCGGILASMEVAALAKAHDLAVVPHIGGLTAVGFAAGLHLGAAIEPEVLEYDPDPYQPLRDELLADPIFGMDRVEDGRMAVPTGPGLGIEIDEAVLDAYPYERGRLYQELYPEHGAGRL